MKTRKRLKLNDLDRKLTINALRLHPDPKSIKTLDLSSNEFEAGLLEHVADFSEVEVLSIRNCGLTEIPESVFELKHLRKLFLGGNKIIEVPHQMSNLDDLEELQLSYNELSAIPDSLKSLTKLKVLWINGNKLTGIPQFIDKLPNLKKLYAQYNNINSISREVVEMPLLVGLFLDGNPLRSIPIYEHGGNMISRLRVYFKSIEEGFYKSFEAKIIFLGDGAVGKSTLISKIINGSEEGADYGGYRGRGYGGYGYRSSAITETKGVEVHSYKIGEFSDGQRTYNVDSRIWDFGGQEIQREVHHLFLSNEALYVLAWANRTVNNKEIYIKQWLNKIDSYGGKDSRVIIVQTMYEEVGLSFSDLNRDSIFKTYDGLVVDFCNVSSLRNFNIHNRLGLKDKMYDHLLMLPNVGKEVSFNWIDIKEEIIELSKTKKIIDVSEFYKLVLQKDVDREQSQLLLKWLNNIGVILHYDNPRSLSRVIFLDPNWVTKVVYKIIIDDDKKIVNNKGMFTYEMIDQYLSRDEEVVVQLMEKFDLCFNLSDNEGNYILPALLPHEELDIVEIDSGTDSIKSEFRFGMLKGSTLPRFISLSYKSRLVFKEEYWRSGVIMRYKNSYAKVYQNKSSKHVENKIRVIVVGNQRFYLFERIREMFTQVVAKSDNYHVFISCSNGIACGEKEKFLFDESIVEKAKQKKVESLQCGLCFKNVRIANLLENRKSAVELSIEDLRVMISHGNLQGTLNSLKGLIAVNGNRQLNDKRLQVEGRLSRLEDEQSIGTISFEQKQVEESKIAKAITSILDEVESYM